MKVKEIMNADVKTTSPETTAQKAAKKMKDFGIGSLIVVKDEKLFGIVTERDMLTKVVATGIDSTKTLVEGVMSKEVIIITPDIEVEEAADLMIDKKVKKLPVVDDDSLLGIVTATDVISAQPKMLERLSELFSVPGNKKIIAG